MSDQSLIFQPTDHFEIFCTRCTYCLEVKAKCT